jgi:hypothetical protein
MISSYQASLLHITNETEGRPNETEHVCSYHSYFDLIIKTRAHTNLEEPKKDTVEEELHDAHFHVP